MQCRDFREVADSYLSDELLVETNHDVIAHLEACADCRRELAARRELRSTLRASFAHAEELRMREEFAARLRTQLRATAMGTATSPATRSRAWLAIAACLLVAATFGLVAMWQRQRVRTPSPQIAGDLPNSNDAGAKPTAAPPRSADTGGEVNVVLAGLSEAAVGDHRDCAVKFRLPEEPIDLEEAGRKYDRAYLGLTKAVRTRGDESFNDVELIEAHSCDFEGHRFAHIVFRHRGRLVSLLVTRLERPSGSPAKQAPTENDPRGQVIACSQVGGYQTSCFQTARHAVFVVSDLSEAENLALARRLARPVYEHIARAEDLT